jgi:hypothetical protein
MDHKASRSSIHEKEDLFSHLPVNVMHEEVDIYDGLSAYFDDIVEYEGKRVRMEVGLVDIPPVLQIQLQVGLRAHHSSRLIDFAPESSVQPRYTPTIQISGLCQIRRDNLPGSLHV